MSELRLPAIPLVGPIALKRRLDAGEDLALLDVREASERELVAIPPPPAGADLFVPLGEVPARLEEIRAAVGGRPLVVYCHHGIRSLIAGRWLATQGLAPVENLDGGVDAYAVEADRTLPRY
jgi:rhodanese-related sulfurtransferase